MGFLDNIFKPQNLEFRGTGIDTSNSLFNFLIKGPTTEATVSTSLNISAFYNGVDIISNDIAKLPKSIFEKDGDSRNKKDEHPAYYLLSQSPNNIMTSFDFWKILTLSVILKGNGYAIIIRNKQTGFEEKFIFVANDDVKVRLDSEGVNLVYEVKGFGLVDQNDILHFKGFSLDGIIGVGVVKYAAKQLGISLDTQEYASQVYRHQGLGHGVVETDKSVALENKRAIESGFINKMNSNERFKIAMLDEGMKYKSIQITPAESMFLETNRLAVIECCRWLNLAPVKIKDMSAGSYLNIYQQGIEHVMDSILPWVTRYEQEVNKKLFGKESALYFKMNINALLRGDLESKRNYYTAMVYAGIYSRNEIRALEELNPIDGLDEILQPVNMQGVSIAESLLNEKK